MSSDTLPSVDAMREAVRTARNDEILEVAMFPHDEMVDRCGNAVELAIEADDRDAMNEAFVLVQLVEDLIPAWLGNKNSRSERTHWRLYAVEERIAEAVTYKRQGSRGAAPTTRRKAQTAKVAAIKKPEEIALAPFTDEEAIEAVVKAWSARDADYRKRHGRSPGDTGAWTIDVACVLAGGDCLDKSVHVRHGDVIRVGQRLGKLMRAGRLQCVSGHGCAERRSRRRH